MDNSTKPPSDVLGAANTQTEAESLRRQIRALKERRAALLKEAQELDDQLLVLEIQYRETPEGHAAMIGAMQRFLEGLREADND